jgi:hypothetical protein
MSIITLPSSAESEYIHGNNSASLVVSRKGVKMSSKVDALLKQAELFERLALYGDRKAYLRALAQTPPEESRDVYAALGNAANQLNSAVQQFISGPAEVQTDLPGRTKGLPTAMRASANVVRQVSEAGVTAQSALSLYNAAKQLANLQNLGSVSEDAKNVWLNSVTAAATNVMDVYRKQWLPLASQQAAPPAEEESGVLQVPETQIMGKVPQKPAYDHDTVVMLQNFLNNALRNQIINGQRGPLAVDGKLGSDTSGALQEWAKASGIGGSDIKSLVDIALGQAK